MCIKAEETLLKALDFEHVPLHRIQLSTMYYNLGQEIIKTLPEGDYRREALEFLVRSKAAAALSSSTNWKK
jgi:hypothetical protein